MSQPEPKPRGGRRDQPHSSGWISEANRSAPCITVARSLGLTIAQDGKSFGPCPFCHRQTRASEQSIKEGRRDRRGPCAVIGGSRWHCYTNGTDGCGAGGGVVDLVAIVLTHGLLDPKNDEQCQTVRDYFGADRDEWVARSQTPLPQAKPPAPRTAPPLTTRAVEPVDLGYDDYGEELSPWLTDDDGMPIGSTISRVAVPIGPAEHQHPMAPSGPADSGAHVAERAYPPASEVEALWQSALPVTLVPEVEAYLRHRGFDPEDVARVDGARALDPTTPLPSWARCDGKRWTESGHLLLFRAMRLVDGKFIFCSIQARCILTAVKIDKKTLWPAGHKSAGLFFVNQPSIFTDGLPVLRLTLTEGSMDWLLWASRPIAQRGAVVGIMSGAPVGDLAAMVPDGWTIAIRNHADDAGDKYTKTVVEQLRHRDVMLWKRGPKSCKDYKDDNDALCGKLKNKLIGKKRPLLNSLDDAEPLLEDSFAPDLPGALDELLIPTYNAKGEPRTDHRLIENTRAILQHYKIRSRWNLLTRQEEYFIPGYRPSTQRACNARLARVHDLLQRHGMVKKPIVEDHLWQLHDEYHPVAEWIDATPWDGKDRLGEFYATLQLSPEQDQDFAYSLLRRWLIQCVAVVLPDLARPTFQTQLVLVLQGPQGAQKSRWFAALAPSGTGWVGSGLYLDPADKDSVIQITGYWIAEIAEMDGVNRSADKARLKAFFSKPLDQYRVPYAKRAESNPRQTIFGATVNPKEFLTDDTGSRRFAVLAVEQCVADHKINMQQLWAQVAELARDGERHWLDNAETAKLNADNRKFAPPDEIASELWEVWRGFDGPGRDSHGPRIAFREIWRRMPISRNGMVAPNSAQRRTIHRELAARGCKLDTLTNGTTVYSVVPLYNGNEDNGNNGGRS